MYDPVISKKRKKTLESPQSKRLEDRLERLESLIQQAIPENATTRDNARLIHTGMQNSLQRASTVSPHRYSDSLRKTNNYDSLVEDMVTAVGRISLDNQGKYAYNGSSSGISFLESSRQRFGDKHISEMRAQVPIGDTLLPRLYHMTGFAPNIMDGIDALPSEANTLSLCCRVFDDACTITHFIHRPTFLDKVKQIYKKEYHEHSHEEMGFLGLLHSVLALGCLFDEEQVEKIGIQAAIQKG